MKSFFLCLLLFLFGCGAIDNGLITHNWINLNNHIQHPIPVILDPSVDEAQAQIAINWIETQLNVPNLFEIVNEQPSYDIFGEIALSTGYIQIVVLPLDTRIGGETDVYSQDGEIVGAVVHVNITLTDTNLRYQAVLEHEMLHALGLADDPVSGENRSIMQAVLIGDGTAYITLHDKKLILGMFR